MQDGKNSTRNSGDQDWKENHRNQRNDWESQMGNDRERNKNNGNRNDRRGVDDRMGSQNEGMGNHDDKMGSYDDRSNNYDRMGNRNSRMGNDGRSRSGGRDDSMGNNRYGSDNLNGRSDFQHDYGRVSKNCNKTVIFHVYWNNKMFFQEFSDQYGHQSTQSPGRYKRERKEENSGKRSQFNPNPKRYQDSNRSDEKSSRDKNASKVDDMKACALHCFLEKLEMVGTNI